MLNVLKNGNELILHYKIISLTLYVHFIYAEESEKRELKGYNIIGYVSDIQGVVPCGRKMQNRKRSANYKTGYQKLASFILGRQAGAVILGWNLQIARKMGKSHSFRWAIL